jgi:hypothetical protein
MKQRCWVVKLWWRDPVRGSFESGANSAWPEGTSPMDVIREVAEWRHVDLSICHTVEAVAGDSFDDGKPAPE